MSTTENTEIERVLPWPEPEKHAATVIFVHGFQSDKDEAWQKSNATSSTSWPDWVAKRYPNLAVAKIGYPTSAVADPASILTKSKILLEVLQDKKEFFDRPVVFICHSMGGILVKQIMLLEQIQHQKMLKDSVKGIVFFATPHRGTSVANYATWLLTGAWSVPQIREMMIHNSYLEALHEMYRFYCTVAHTDLEHKAFHELYKYKGILVVPQTSAELNIGNVRSDAVERDHVEICKFAHFEEPGYRSTVKFLEFVLDSTGALDQPVDYGESYESPPNGYTPPKPSVRWTGHILGSTFGTFFGLCLVFLFSELRFQQSIQLISRYFTEMVGIGVVALVWSLFVAKLNKSNHPTTSFLYAGAGVVVFWVIVNFALLFL